MGETRPDGEKDNPPVLGGVPLFYRGRAANPPRSEGLPKPVRFALDMPALYDPDEALIAAANVALTLRLPLLLTGRPGTGKTELARSLVRALHAGDERWLFEVTVSSTSDKSDLLYRFDELGRLRDAYAGKAGQERGGRKKIDGYTQQSPGEGVLGPSPANPPTGQGTGRDGLSQQAANRNYLELRGLGAAIVAAGRPDDKLAPIVTGRKLPEGLSTLADLVGPPPPERQPSTTDDQQSAAQHTTVEADPRVAAFVPAGGPPPVVLIDEIDKAPRELPNDLLTELDRMRFAIPELGVSIRLANEDRWPVIVITSNAERPLSDAFLRRCVCFEVETPGKERLQGILEAKLRALRLLDTPGNLPAAVIDFVEAVRQDSQIADMEKPGTARVLDFAVLLADRARFGGVALPQMPPALMRAALTALLPSPAAQKRAMEVWEQWKLKPPPT